MKIEKNMLQRFNYISFLFKPPWINGSENKAENEKKITKIRYK